MNPFETPLESPENPGSGPITERRPASHRTPETRTVERREAGAFQVQEIVPAEVIPGFRGMEVVITLQCKEGEGRDVNEDNILADPRTGLLGVFDGVGGSANPSGASRVAEYALVRNYERTADDAKSKNYDVLRAELRGHLERRARDTAYRPQEPRENAAGRLEAAGALLEAMSDTDPELVKKSWALLEALRDTNQTVARSRGSTTACVGMVHTSPNGKHWAIVANVGDSGAFIRHDDGSMEPITEEDSLIQRLRESGNLPLPTLFAMKQHPNKRFPITISRDGIRTEKHEMSYYNLSVTIVESMGEVEPFPSLSVRELPPGTELIFCTDGVIDKFETMVDPSTNFRDFQPEQTDLEKLADATFGSTLPERLDDLRLEASFQKTYKIADDIAIVGARVEEKK